MSRGLTLVHLIYWNKKNVKLSWKECGKFLYAYPYIGKRNIITFAFHFFHFKTFSRKVEKWFFHFSKAKVKVEKWFFHFSKAKVKVEKWFFHSSKAKVKVKKVKKSLFHFSGKSLKVKKVKSESDYFSLSNVCLWYIIWIGTSYLPLI